jgi:hypothetical protein
MKWLLILGIIVVELFATGGIHFEFYSRTDPAPAAASSENQVSASIAAPPASARLGGGVRTGADVRWLRRMNTLCAQRNGRENALPGSVDTALALARYSAQTLWIWDDYQRRASAIRAPGSYGAEAGWVQQVDALKRAGIKNVLNAARSEDEEAVNAGMSAFGDLSASVYPTFVKIGLTACGRFQP